MFKLCINFGRSERGKVNVLISLVDCQSLRASWWQDDTSLTIWSVIWRSRSLGIIRRRESLRRKCKGIKDEHNDNHSNLIHFHWKTLNTDGDLTIETVFLLQNIWIGILANPDIDHSTDFFGAGAGSMDVAR